MSQSAKEEAFDVMKKALEKCKETLESDNQGITDTIWISPWETLVDRIYHALDAARAVA
jgi:hypothetical protein